MGEAVDRPDPDTTAAGRHLRSFTANLKEAGALATAGVALAESIAKVAHWLGPSARPPSPCCRCLTLSNICSNISLWRPQKVVLEPL